MILKLLLYPYSNNPKFLIAKLFLKDGDHVDVETGGRSCSVASSGSRIRNWTKRIQGT